MGGPARITYDKGTLLVWGVRSAPHCSWDPRVGDMRIMAAPVIEAVGLQVRWRSLDEDDAEIVYGS